MFDLLATLGRALRSSVRMKPRLGFSIQRLVRGAHQMSRLCP
jgi:hypothetical protein